jgi:C1A family cysteine protease
VTCSAVGVPKTSSILFSPLPPRKDYTFFASEVKNQRSCGACWIFTSVAAVEVLLKRKKYFGLARKDTVDISLSEQELLDCILQVDYCKGGDLETAIEFMNKTGVIDEQLYPYRKDNNASLPRPMCLAPYRLTSRIVLGYENCYLPKTSAMTPGSEVETLLMKMAFMGPVAVGFSVPAELIARIGISNVYKVTEETCLNVTSAGHGMLLVGYGGGPDDKQDPLSEPYWIFKNSWGTAWGEFGYIRIARNMACNIFIQFLRPDILRDI